MERNVKLKLRIDYKAMKYYNVYNLKYKKKFIWVYIFLILVCIGASVAMAITKSYLIAVLFAAFAAYLGYQTINLEKMIDRQIVAYFQRNRPIEQNIEINDEFITISSIAHPDKTINYEWIHITEIHEIPQYYFLFIKKQPIIISKDPEDVLEGSQEMLAEIIKEKAAGKPYKVTNKEIAKNNVDFEYPNYDEFQEEHIEEAEVVENEAEEIKVEVDNPEDVEEAGNPKDQNDND